MKNNSVMRVRKSELEQRIWSYLKNYELENGASVLT